VSDEACYTELLYLLTSLLARCRGQNFGLDVDLEAKMSVSVSLKAEMLFLMSVLVSVWKV